MTGTVSDVSGGGQLRKRLTRAGIYRGDQTQTSGDLVRVCCSRRFGCFADLGSGVADTSDRVSGDLFSGFLVVLSLRACPRDVIGS